MSLRYPSGSLEIRTFRRINRRLLFVAFAGICLPLPGLFNLVVFGLETVSGFLLGLMPESGNPDAKASNEHGHQANQSGPEGVKHG
ncbi:exported hypothetical protein [Candidatus Competibacter denitrificans Run_A_D11]|uniref:Uncharacterized protein n=1 Tax=Candidatus Competibacter denitrificans Run_A_D11 TaxID=1400863 RepID=W6MCL5_9GAMM|nr:exported hypothetical protein [Candidatus Competibacter denitrificans Run_A_D11]